MKKRKGCGRKAGINKKGETAYRMKCAKTANGLSHYVMYGDVPEGKAAV